MKICNFKTRDAALQILSQKYLRSLCNTQRGIISKILTPDINLLIKCPIHLEL